MASFETPNLKITTSLVVFENNENNTTTTSETNSSGLFITPSNGISGYLLISSNELGKLQFMDPSEFFSIDDLSDISITEPLLDNQVLQYDSGTGMWTNETLVFPETLLNDLSDVTITNPLNNDILQYNTTTWINEPVPVADTDKHGVMELAQQADIQNDVGGDGVLTSDTVNNIMNVSLDRIVNIELAASATASNSATLELTWTENSNFQNYLITVHNIVPVDLNTGYLSLRVSQDGGASWESGATDYRSRFQKNASVSITAPSNDRTYLHGKIFGGINDATIAGPFSGNYMFLSPDNDTRIKKIFGMSRFTDFLTGKETMLYVGTFLGNTQSINGLQFEFANSSTNIASGSVHLYRF